MLSGLQTACEVADVILQDIGKKYGEKVALEHIDLEIEEGKITAVLGESGAGKTTLLHILAGLLPHEGEIQGRRPTSYLFQEAKLLPHLTVEGNLKFVLAQSEWERIGPVLERVGLGGRQNSLPKTLSGGEKQRVAIARAFLYPHEALLMDEPFSSLDLALKRTLMELVAELWREKRQTVVFVTHDVHEAAVLAHRALVLRAGRIAADLPVEGEPPRDFFVTSSVEAALVRALTGFSQ